MASAATVEDALIERVLRAVHRSRYRWRTTGALARELNVQRGALYAALCAEAERGTSRRLRYHPYPSVHTLDVLWGATDAVGEDDLPPLERIDVPHEAPEREAGAPVVFLSHNHRDAPIAVAIERCLVDAGVYPWLYTAEIEQGGPIIDTVNQALRQCDALLVVVSAASVGSLWVRKEFGLALEQLVDPHAPVMTVGRVLPVLDGGDPELVDLLGRPVRTADPERWQEYSHQAAVRFGREPGSYVRNADEFARSLYGFFETGGSVAVFPPSEEVPSGVRVLTVAEWAQSLTNECGS